MRRLANFAVAGLVVVAMAAGCGDDEETTVTEQRTVTEAEPAPPSGTGSETVEDDLSGAGNHGPRHFQTPSGNIGCYLDASGARCDIRGRSWNPPPAPASCELDYGQGLTLGRDGASFVCAGDTTLGGPATLAYGSSAQRGPFLCESEAAGVTCTDVGTGAGFFVSREDYRIF
jgi:hypothetical protein